MCVLLTLFSVLCHISMTMSTAIVYKAVNSIRISETFTVNYEGDYIVSSRFEITAVGWRDVPTAHDQSFLLHNA
jgi:hypothetical protein